MKILVGISGGFDSACAAKRLIDEGHTVEGAILVMHELSDTSDAERVAASLGIPIHIIDCREEFSRTVIENFVVEYKKARTPNPCVICNPLVKFKCLQLFAKEHGFDRIATGHYAKVSDWRGVRTLSRGRDLFKDQTYMLYRLPQDILNMLVLPLSSDVKSELRDMAQGGKMEEFDKPDSQEICFIPDGDYAGYIEEVTGPSRQGNFIDVDGNILGEHKGIIHYTVGQRKGLGISLGERAFVTDIDTTTGNITLAREPKMSSRAELSEVVFLGELYQGEEKTLFCSVKIRYAAPQVPATVTLRPDSTATVSFDAPQRSVTAGQSMVFYDGDILLGGGFID